MKKLFITLLTFLFLLSATGLPVSLHFCQTKKLITFSYCEVCSSNKLEEESICCSEVEADFSEQIIIYTLNHCCEIKIIESSIKDAHLLVTSYSFHDLSNLSQWLKTNIVFPDINNSKIYFHFCDTSPQFLCNDIYLINATFLI